MSKSKSSKWLQSAAAVTLAASLALPAASASAAEPAKTSVLPIREAAAKLGAEVHWNQSKGTITLKKGSHVLVLNLGTTKAILDGKTVSLSEPVRITEGRTVVDPASISKWLTDVVKPDTADLFLKEIQSGNGDKAAKYVSESSAYALPAQILGKLWINNTAYFGKAEQQPIKQESTNSVHRNVTYTFNTDKIPFTLTVRLNSAGKVDDLYLTVATASTYHKPAYDNASAYTEREVTVGSGAFALPGTLTLPAGKGPFPAVVLVHGSGTNDRDETIGGGKPLRDLAVGLAAQGIAVLRYDKVTYEHSFKVAADAKFTLKRETVDDALAAVDLLKKTEGIDASQIFVAGHSQGGFAMPLIIANDQNKSIAGTILLSGPSGKFADVLAEQQKEVVNRVKKLGMDATPYEQQAAQYIAIANMVNDPKYTTDNMPSNFPLSPAYWWFEQKNYIPSELAKKQSGPMLVLQGENDWQVTMNQFEGWKTALKDRKDVEFKSYPKVNHLLAEYNGISVGEEYTQPSNVSKAIVDDIANWVKKTVKK